MQLPSLWQESAALGTEGVRKHFKSLSRDEEKLQQFAQVFLTMRQIASQQQRAQSAPPFPPSVLPPCTQTCPQITPASVFQVQAEGKSTQELDYSCLDIENPIAPSPPSQSQVTEHGRDVVLDMAELLKTLEQYYEREDATCSGIITEMNLENGSSWNMQKKGSNRTSAALGIKHLRLMDVNAVLIVLVAVVVYTRTMCRDVFFRTRHSPRKQ